MSITLAPYSSKPDRQPAQRTDGNWHQHGSDAIAGLLDTDDLLLTQKTTGRCPLDRVFATDGYDRRQKPYELN
jgi:hypothetical protein